MQCPVLPYEIPARMLCDCYLMSGTDRGCAAGRRRLSCARSASWYWKRRLGATLLAYQRARTCPVLTRRMAVTTTTTTTTSAL
eukprot:3937416-Rhodomonas_salina.1